MFWSTRSVFEWYPLCVWLVVRGWSFGSVVRNSSLLHAVCSVNQLSVFSDTFLKHSFGICATWAIGARSPMERVAGFFLERPRSVLLGFWELPWEFHLCLSEAPKTFSEVEQDVSSWSLWDGIKFFAHICTFQCSSMKGTTIPFS